MSKHHPNQKGKAPMPPHGKKKQRDAWLLFMIFGMALGAVGALISGTENNSYYIIGIVAGGLIGFLIGRSLDQLAEKRKL